jgi:nicotinate-nucleotide adenylyltransferase
MRLGVFGGSFDPVHYGHLLLAECCREALALEEVWLVPAAQPPHKQDRTLAPGKARLEMLELALADHESIKPSALELERGGLSFTVDTLEAIRQRQPKAELFLLLGADSLRELPTWRQPGRICELAWPVAVRRSGNPEPDYRVLEGFVPPPRLEAVRRLQVEMPLIDLSSTELRRRARLGLSLRFRTPRAVEEYIRAHGLYREAPA